MNVQKKKEHPIKKSHTTIALDQKREKESKKKCCTLQNHVPSLTLLQCSVLKKSSEYTQQAKSKFDQVVVKFTNYNFQDFD
jgi:hypothetical protein